MNIQEVESLKQNIDNTNQRLAVIKAQVESAKQRQQEILNQYGCATFTDFQAVLKSKEDELGMLVQAAQKYLNEVQPLLSQAEGIINGVG